VIIPVNLQALDDAGLKLSDNQGIAVTRGPGLVGSTAGRAFRCQGIGLFSKASSLLGLNHIEGTHYARDLSE
jgi:N6-L-threonylcarbamoyladenine synthase